MKLLFKHDLPKRLRSAEVYFEIHGAQLYLTVDGWNASVKGSIGAQPAQPVQSDQQSQPEKGVAISDKEYSSYRASHGVVGVVDEDDDRVVLKNSEGYEEEWLRPKWVLNGVRRSREGADQPPSNKE